MEFVEPIRDREKITEILAYLKEKNYRDYLLFLIGINIGRRISDILKLRYEDISGEVFYMKEQKTGKMIEISINKVLRKEIKAVPEDRLKDFIFKSREGKSYISRQRAYQIIKDIEKRFDLKNLGTHTLRKTFGYHFYQKSKNIYILMMIFGHSKEDVTYRYIGISSQMVNDAYKSFNLF